MKWSRPATFCTTNLPGTCSAGLKQSYYEVRASKEYFDDIDKEKIPKDMLDLAIPIVETKKGTFDPSKFEDQYEDALKELIEKKRKGQKIEALSAPSKSNVII